MPSLCVFTGRSFDRNALRCHQERTLGGGLTRGGCKWQLLQDHPRPRIARHSCGSLEPVFGD